MVTAIYMDFNDFATRFAVMMVLRLPRGYELLTPQWRYTRRRTECVALMKVISALCRD